MRLKVSTVDRTVLVVPIDYQRLGLHLDFWSGRISGRAEVKLFRMASSRIACGI